ncbi:MAG: type II toxin-antitoxin system VapC family toxin [Gammaproteobacteria bacterium]|nr:type II toxin-antitoxin system VapC family toxin [Gammaproteobacteria bacterium]
MLLDTHVLLWLRVGEQKLGPRARREIERAWRSDEVCVSAISFWEIAMLQQRGRIGLRSEIEPWRREQLREGIVEIPIDGQVGIRAAGLAGFHADPADRLIVATALDGHRLVTADRRILGWAGRLDRLAAGD